MCAVGESQLLVILIIAEVPLSQDGSIENFWEVAVSPNGHMGQQ